MSKTPSSKSKNVCRICLHKAKKYDPLIEPCNCTSELAFCHASCISSWIETTKIDTCDICCFRFITFIELPSFRDWLSEDEEQALNFFIGFVSIFLSFYIILLGEVTTSMAKGGLIYGIVVLMTSIAEIAFLGWTGYFIYSEITYFTVWQVTHLKITVKPNPHKSLANLPRSVSSLSNISGSHRKSHTAVNQVKKVRSNTTFIEFPAQNLEKRSVSHENVNSEIKWDFEPGSQSKKIVPKKKRKGKKKKKEKAAGNDMKNAAKPSKSSTKQLITKAESSTELVSKSKSKSKLMASKSSLSLDPSNQALNRHTPAPNGVDRDRKSLDNYAGLMATGGVRRDSPHFKKD